MPHKTQSTRVAHNRTLKKKQLVIEDVETFKRELLMAERMQIREEIAQLHLSESADLWSHFRHSPLFPVILTCMLLGVATGALFAFFSAPIQPTKAQAAEYQSSGMHASSAPIQSYRIEIRE